MSAQSLLLNLGIGCILGVLGQSLRAVAGLKKHGVTSALPVKDSNGEQFSWTKFGISMILGGVAGMLGMLILWDSSLNINKETALGLLAAGYSGSDFLEGVIKWLPSHNTNNQ